MEALELAEVMRLGGATDAQIDEVLQIQSVGKYSPETVEKRRAKFHTLSKTKVTVCEGDKANQRTITIRYLGGPDIRQIIGALPEIWRHVKGEDKPDDKMGDYDPIGVAGEIFEAALLDNKEGQLTAFTKKVLSLMADLLDHEKGIDWEYLDDLPLHDQGKLFWGIIAGNKERFSQLWARGRGLIPEKASMLIGVIMSLMNSGNSPQDTTSSDGGAVTSGTAISISQSQQKPKPRSKK